MKTVSFVFFSVDFLSWKTFIASIFVSLDYAMLMAGYQSVYPTFMNTDTDQDISLRFQVSLQDFRDFYT